MSSPASPESTETSLPWQALRPFISVIVLDCVGDDPPAAFGTLVGFLTDASQETSADARIVASAEGADDVDVDQLAGFVTERQGPPSWATPDGGLVDVTHHLTVVLRQGRLVAVHTDDVTSARLQRWLDRPPRPSFRRLPPDVLEGTLLQGEAKGLWLRGTDKRTTTRPDTKNLGGLRLQDALDPFDDASFAMGSARAALPLDPERSSLRGTVGATPRKSLVWLRSASSFAVYVSTVTELLDLLAGALGHQQRPAFPMLAQEVTALDAVYGAYDVLISPPEELLTLPGLGADERDAAELLQNAVIVVHGEPKSPRFVIDVGFDGVISGSLRARPKENRSGYQLDIGFVGEPTNPAPAQAIRKALGDGELVTVYYRSGHTFTQGGIFTRRLSVAPFPNWRFEDFDGYRITVEKPDTSGRQATAPQAMHDAIGDDADTSLFGWVARHYADGLLTCDDGPGEIADFLHVDNGVLSLVHVKAAHSPSPKRGVSASAYEVVTSQAVKNLVFTEPNRLRDRLANAPVRRPACWRDGERVGDRTEFVKALDARDATDPVRVVIVQPHLSRRTYRRLRKPTDSPSDETLRLHLLESLLNGARGTLVRVNADLTVVGGLS
jgi:hypothetical protein